MNLRKKLITVQELQLSGLLQAQGGKWYMLTGHLLVDQEYQNSTKERDFD
jgi:hypothetical protein